MSADNTLNQDHSVVVFLLSHCVFAAFKGSVTPISEQELLAVTNNVSDIRRNRSVVFTVTAPPKFGHLVQRMADNSTKNISTFTQSMVGMCVSLSVVVCLCSILILISLCLSLR